MIRDYTVFTGLHTMISLLDPVSGQNQEKQVKDTVKDPKGDLKKGNRVAIDFVLYKQLARISPGFSSPGIFNTQA
jgi:hypothetical protein